MEDKMKFIPPIPKFSFKKEEVPQNNQKTLDEEMSNFFAELNNTPENKNEPPLKQKQSEESSKKISAVPAKDLSSINSKLSDLLKKRELMVKDQPVLPPQVKPPPQQQNLKKLGQSEEYDPARPNDYEEYKRNFFEEQKLIKKSSKESPKLENMEIEPKINEAEKIQEEPTIKSAEEKALKMMQKYGFKVGEGLGKNSQGMTTPLIAQKTSDTVGVIKASVLDMTKLVGYDQLTQPLVQTRVLVLLNMVTPGQVDDDLEGEITEELSKYGMIRKCLIYMQPHLEEDIAVRIFVEFEKKEDAAKAFPFVEGRVFEKRIVVCRYYSEESFASNIFDDPIV